MPDNNDHTTTATQDMFDEKRLRADIAATWGEHGAHIDVFDFMLAEVRALQEVIRIVSSVRPHPLYFSNERLAAAVQRALESGRNADA